MIGVICCKSEKETANEFFQLFKTPWEFYNNSRNYDVVLATYDEINEVLASKTKLLILYGSHQYQLDGQSIISINSSDNDASIFLDKMGIPIYGKMATFATGNQSLLQIQNDSAISGIQFKLSQMSILRVGFDLFEEVAYLLTKGQPVENAHIPTLDKHIMLLRSWILAAGIPLVEIPAVPTGHSFTVCLTHDVDFIGIRQHKFDHTMWGFLYRAFVSSTKAALTGRLSIRKLWQNYKAVISLPFIYLGTHRDIWFQFDRYIEIEQDLRSTFFIIPFKGRPGENVLIPHPERRATRYEIDDIKAVVYELLQKGFEVGLHGIDAWRDVDSARLELNRITKGTGQTEMGIRIHWLCFDENSPKILDNAGFRYDSTFGYNESIGYKGGITQVFQPFGVANLLELPLHIQDVALLSANHNGITETQAWEQCQSLINNAEKYGGVLTVLWHLRSLAPERLWEDFYVELLNELQKRGAWFTTASQVVAWFQARRSIRFENVSFSKNDSQIDLKFSSDLTDSKLKIRVYLPESSYEESLREAQGQKYVDIPWNGEEEVSISINEPAEVQHIL